MVHGLNKSSAIVVAGDIDGYSLWASLLVLGLQYTDDQMSRYGRGCSRERDDPDDVGRDGIKPTKIPRTSLRMIPRATLGSRSD